MYGKDERRVGVYKALRFHLSSPFVKITYSNRHREFFQSTQDNAPIPKNTKPRIFVGSSVEGLDIACEIQNNLDHDAEVTVWSQGIFTLSSYALDDLITALDNSDFGVFVFSPDDIATIRNAEHKVTRDNVVFEIGLFIGHLGENRNYFVIPRDAGDFHIPTDLTGIKAATFEPNRSDNNLHAALGSACNEIRKAIRKLGPIVKKVI